MDPNRKITKKFTKKFDSKVVNRQCFHRKTGPVQNFFRYIGFKIITKVEFSLDDFFIVLVLVSL